MNSNTRLALIDFATAVQKIAVSTSSQAPVKLVLEIGLADAVEIVEVAETLKIALRHDETITS